MATGPNACRYRIAGRVLSRAGPAGGLSWDTRICTDDSFDGSAAMRGSAAAKKIEVNERKRFMCGVLSS